MEKTLDLLPIMPTSWSYLNAIMPSWEDFWVEENEYDENAQLVGYLTFEAKAILQEFLRFGEFLGASEELFKAIVSSCKDEENDLGTQFVTERLAIYLHDALLVYISKLDHVLEDEENL